MFFRFISALCVFATGSVSALAAATARPNVLFVCVDDLKPALGCYGDPLAQSPNIDRLARGGTVFERAYCNQAVCSPSRNALMTGLRSTTTGIYDLPTNFRVATPDAVTVAQHFKANGWRTEALGKIFHTGHGNHEDERSWSVPHWRPRAGNYALPANTGRERGPAVENANVADNVYPDGKIADEAIERLKAAKQNAGQPFFLAVGFLRPHLPFNAPKKYWDRFDRAKFPLAEVTSPPAGAPAYAPTNSGELRNYEGVPAGPIPAEQQRELIHGYYAATSFMDGQVGRILDELDRLDLARNTIVVFWGDHGWHLGDHGQWCKHTNYEQATRIPLIVRVPGISSAVSKTRALVESVDVFPTLIELAGLPSPQTSPRLDGRSFADNLRQAAAPSKEAIFHAYPRTRPGEGLIIGRAVRTDRYRLVEWKKPGAASSTAEFELYDYTADPLETKNLAAEQTAVTEKLQRLLATQPEAKPPVRGPNKGKSDTTKKKEKSGK